MQNALFMPPTCFVAPLTNYIDHDFLLLVLAVYKQKQV